MHVETARPRRRAECVCEPLPFFRRELRSDVDDARVVEEESPSRPEEVDGLVPSASVPAGRLSTAVASRVVGRAFRTLGDPAESFFVRSDHYNFVRRGIPSVFLWPGEAGPGKAAFEDFMAHHYHQPSDDVSLPIDWSQGIRFVDANYAIAREIADGDARPRWNKGDFFGLLYNGYGAK